MHSCFWIELILPSKVMANLRTKLSAAPPTLVVSNNSTEEHMWMVDGATVSMASEAIWVLEDVSLSVELDTGEPIDPLGVRDIVSDLHDGLQSAYAPEMIELVTPGAVVETTTTTTTKATTALGIFVKTNKPITAAPNNKVVIFITLAIVAVLIVVAGMVVILSWLCCRKCRSVNIFVNTMSKYRKVTSRRRKNSRVVMCGARVQPTHIIVGPTTAIKYEEDSKNSEGIYSS